MLALFVLTGKAPGGPRLSSDVDDVGVTVHGACSMARQHLHFLAVTMCLSLSFGLLICEMGTAVIIPTCWTGVRIKDRSGQALSTIPSTEWMFEREWLSLRGWKGHTIGRFGEIWRLLFSSQSNID